MIKEHNADEAAIREMVEFIKRNTSLTSLSIGYTVCNYSELNSLLIQNSEQIEQELPALGEAIKENISLQALLFTFFAASV